MGVIVAGGAGFIGSHLVDRLVHRTEVVVFDNMFTGRLANLESALRSERAVLAYVDVADRTESLAEVLARATHGSITAIYHLAASNVAGERAPRPWAALAVQGYGTMQLLKLAERVGARFVYVSTAEASVATLHRGTLADAEGKRFGEALCIAAQTELGIDARIVRVPECYGPRMPLDSEHVIPVLLRASNTRGQPALRAAPFERRELTYVEDVVSGIEAAAEARSEQAAPVTLLESAGSATVKEIVETFARVAQRGKEPVYLPTDDEGYVASQALAAYPVKAAADLGWRPQTALEAGLALTYQWYRSAGKRYAPV